MRLLFLFISTFIISINCDGQLPYTLSTFSFSTETDIQYGVAQNFAGINDTLLLDIYKPIGDQNCYRPCLVFVHGGSWIGGSKEDQNIVNIAKEFAKKGWVVATVNYRLGTHKTSNYNMYAVCNTSISAPCGYIADSAEVFRANYRGQQDVKGAIRYMKERSIIDSIDVNNVFVAGESAGAFIAYAATFLDDPNEKPSFCNTISNAPNPDADLVSCLPINYSLSRPDLGSIDGDLNVGNYNASVQGVGSFYGGMMDFDMLSNTTSWPTMYMFHQGSDVVVHYNYYRLLGRIDWECYAPLNVCQQYAKYPKAYGSKGIENYLNSLGTQPVRAVEVIENYEYQNDFTDNGHSIDNWLTRSQNMADLFASRINLNGNTPSSSPCNLGTQEIVSPSIEIFPNPSNGDIYIQNNTNELFLAIYSSQGKLIRNSFISQNEKLSLNSGVYIFKFTQKNGEVITRRVVIQH